MFGLRPIRNVSIRTKILVPVTICMALLIVLTVLIVNRRVTRQFRIDAWNTLAAADAEFRNYQKNRSDDLLLRFRNLPKEPRYRAAFQLGDGPTLRQPLADLLAEQGADIVLYATAPTKVLGCEKREQTKPEASFESAARLAIQQALEGHETVDIVRVGDRLYTLVAVPVFVGQELIGSLTLGLEIGDKEARRLGRSAHGQVAFLAGEHVTAATLSAPDVSEKCLAVFDNCLLPVRVAPPSTSLTEIILDGEHYFGLSGRFESLAGDKTLGYVLLSSYENPLRALHEMQLLLLEVSACTILAGSWFIWWLTKKATQPLQILREGVEAVGRGDFSRRLEIKSRDECGELARVYNGMAESLRISKEQLEKANAELIESSRLAGMAEAATGVLHNVRNVVTTVNIASALVSDRVTKSKCSGLGKLVSLLRQHESDLAPFLMHDSKGKQVIDYLDQLANHLTDEQQAIVKELGRMQDCIEHMKGVVTAQQSYAKKSGVAEKIKVSELIEDALKMNSALRSDIRVVKEFPEDLTVNVEKHKALQVLVNLIRNAKQACDASLSPLKTVTVSAANGGDRVRLAVTDNGVGIPPENLGRIFSHGFTTKKEGHGFGLHHSATVAQELGGLLRVHSDGEGKGATFTLELPAVWSKAQTA